MRIRLLLQALAVGAVSPPTSAASAPQMDQPSASGAGAAALLAPPGAPAPQRDQPSAPEAGAPVPKYIKVDGLMQRNPAYVAASAAGPTASSPAGGPSGQPVPEAGPALSPRPGSVPKYIKVNGLMQKNPEHPANWPSAAPSPRTSKMAAPANSLTPICSLSDIANQNACGEKVHLSEATEMAFNDMQDTSTLAQYAPGIDSGELIDGLGNMFARYGTVAGWGSVQVGFLLPGSVRSPFVLPRAGGGLAFWLLGIAVGCCRYEVPIGLISKLHQLSNEHFHLEFLMDDSGSMNTPDATRLNGEKATRWEEAHERLLILMEILAYVPVAGVRIQFLNRPDVIELDHHQHTPASFLMAASDQINRCFAKKASSTTPLVERLESLLQRAEARPGRTAVYLFFDGEPNGGKQGIDKTARLLEQRTAFKIPFTFVPCTGNEEAVGWAKHIEEKPMPDGSPSFMSELDDFESEKKEVLQDQVRRRPPPPFRAHTRARAAHTYLRT